MAYQRKQENNGAVALYEQGMSIADIARLRGVSRQALWTALNRRGVKFRSNLGYGTENHFYRGTRAVDKAQNVLEKAVLRGQVERKTKCEECGDGGTFKDGRSKIQAHHPNYNKPLKVMWLCQKCHHNWHKGNKAIMPK